ncbi:MAG: hypothetical protein ACI92W_003337, partial [Paraglaciecola sp.]
FYANVDNIFGTLDVLEASSVNVKFGINFLFGRPSAD